MRNPAKDDGLRAEGLARGLYQRKIKNLRSGEPRRLMKKVGSKNRGSHPDGLPLARSGLYISCAYPTVNSLKSGTPSSGFSDLLFHDDVAQILEESHTKARSHERGKGKGIISDSENLRAAASPHGNSSEVSSENLRAFVALCEPILRPPTISAIVQVEE
ncbi:MAG: hypothetical protein SH807_10655 [Blastochloris sp.]|nr:hypothetical protein [Blastochloris sp.]